MFFSLFRVAMGFVKSIRVGDECLETGLGAEIDRPAAMSDPWKIRWVGVAEDPSAESDEARTLLFFGRIGQHASIVLV